jgi:hypothetical protein
MVEILNYDEIYVYKALSLIKYFFGYIGKESFYIGLSNFYNNSVSDGLAFSFQDFFDSFNSELQERNLGIERKHSRRSDDKTLNEIKDKEQIITSGENSSTLVPDLFSELSHKNIETNKSFLMFFESKGISKLEIVLLLNNNRNILPKEII